MNDAVVEEVDPFRLIKYLSKQTIADLGFNTFRGIQTRKLRAQYIINRITSDNIGEFIIAIRQGGYEHIYRQIKEGKLLFCKWDSSDVVIIRMIVIE